MPLTFDSFLVRPCNSLPSSNAILNPFGQLISCKYWQVHPLKNVSVLVKNLDTVWSNKDFMIIAELSEEALIKLCTLKETSLSFIHLLHRCIPCMFYMKWFFECWLCAEADVQLFMQTLVVIPSRSEEAPSTAWSSGTVSSRPWMAALGRNALAPASMGRRPQIHQTWGR